jgi:hypothetical protein
MGFSRIMAEPDGAAIYGIWHCLVGACSQQPKRNGWLTDDGERAVSGWGVQDLVLKFRRPAAEIERALDFLSSPKIGWIVCHTHRSVTAESPPSHHDENANEINGSSVTAESPPSHQEGRKERREGGSEATPLVLKPFERISLERELKEINRELPGLGQLSDHDRGDRSHKRILELRERQKELRKTLGVVA